MEGSLSRRLKNNFQIPGSKMKALYKAMVKCNRNFQSCKIPTSFLIVARHFLKNKFKGA